MRQSIKNRLGEQTPQTSSFNKQTLDTTHSTGVETMFNKAECEFIAIEQCNDDVEDLIRIADGLEAIEKQQPLDINDSLTKACVDSIAGEVGLEAKDVVEDIVETIRRIWRTIYNAIRKGIRQVKIWLKTLLDGTEKFKTRVDALSERLTTVSTESKDKTPITAPLISAALDVEGEVSPLLIKDRLSLVTPLFSKQMVGNVEAVTSMLTGMAKVDPTDIKTISVFKDAVTVKEKVDSVLGGIVLSKKKLPLKEGIIQVIFPRVVVSDIFEFTLKASQVHSTETLPGNKAIYVLSSKLIGKHEHIKVKSAHLNLTARLGSLSLINPSIKLTENKLPVLSYGDMVDLCTFVSSKLDDVIYFNDYYTKRSLKSSEAMFDQVDKLSDTIYSKVEDRDQAAEARSVFKVISNMSQEVYQLSEGLTLNTVRYTIKTCRAIIKYVEESASRYESNLDESTLLESK